MQDIFVCNIPSSILTGQKVWDFDFSSLLSVLFLHSKKEIKFFSMIHFNSIKQTEFFNKDSWNNMLRSKQVKWRVLYCVKKMVAPLDYEQTD